MVDVFISYSRDDQALVRRLAEAVKREGYSVWWDDALPPHRAYGDVIAEQIDAAKAAIVVWSETAAASQWVRAEADAARTQSKLIQVSIDGRVPPIPFSQIHSTGIGDWQGEDDHPGWLLVKESLAALAGGGASAAPPAHPMPRTPPPAAAPAKAAPDRWRWLLIGVILFSVLVVASVGLLVWLGRAPPPAPVSAPAPVAAPLPPPPARAAEAQPRAKAAPPPPPKAAPANPRALRRYCLGRGRNTPQCRQLRAQYRN